MINAGKYNHKITIQRVVWVTDSQGFQTKTTETVLVTYAEVKTTKGMTIIRNNSDFEKALTRFTIRYPKTEITRDDQILFGGKIYTIEYLNHVDEGHVELEIQAKEVTH